MSNLSFSVLKVPFGFILISSEDDDDGDQVFVVVTNAELKSIQAFEKLKRAGIEPRPLKGHHSRAECAS